MEMITLPVAEVVRFVTTRDDCLGALRAIAGHPLEGEIEDGFIQSWDEEGMRMFVAEAIGIARNALAKAGAS